LAGGAGLNTTVLPFILRGVNLLGIDSSKCSKEERVAIWKRLPTNLPLDKLDAMMQIVPMSGVIKEGARILEGKIRGRTVVDVNV
jgi:acrylyl-CoA reductase (NADPH)